MRFLDLEHMLDDRFDFGAFAEPHGWDFALSGSARAELLASSTPLFQATFNGLLLPCDMRERHVRRAHLLVFPETGMIEDVLIAERDRDDPGAVIVTHHPVDMETTSRGFLPMPARQLDQLFAAGIGILVIHAPLDCHREISTSGALADALELRRAGTFAPFVGGHCGVIADGPGESFVAFAERVRLACELPCFRADAIRFAGRDVRRVAIVAGGGDDLDYLLEAETLGVDTYLAGHWWTPHEGAWCDENRRRLRDGLPSIGMNLLSASHGGSELVVFRDQLEPMLRTWGLETRLWRQQDHWR